MKLKTKRNKKDYSLRVWEIDALRGLSMLLRILDHLAFDFGYLLPQMYSNYFSINNPFIRYRENLCYQVRNSNWALICHFIFSGLFFVLSGISCSFSHNNFVHALKILLGCAILDGVTYALYFITGGSRDARILFGVLFPLGISVLFVAIIDKLFKNEDARFLFALSVFIFVICLANHLYYSEIYIDEITSFRDVIDLLTGKFCFGADYFPLIPYLAPTFFGAAFGKVFYKKKQTLLPIPHAFFKPFCFMGRNTRWVYLVHQPIRIALLVLITLPRGYRF